MNLLLYLIFLSLETIVPVFPLIFIRYFAKISGKFFYYIIPVRKNVALRNLEIAFPEKIPAQLKNILKESYINIFTVIFEFFWFRNLSSSKLNKMLLMTNPGLVQEKLKAGKGLILLSAHFGNWELGAFGAGQICGKPFNVIVKQQSNKLIDRRINKIRQMKGNKMIALSEIKNVISGLRKNQIVAMLSDQYAPNEDSLRVKFFAENVPAFAGAARVALHTGAAVLFGAAVRGKDGNYTITLLDIDIKNKNADNIMQEYTGILVSCIRKNPEQWLWFHRRFKHLANY